MKTVEQILKAYNDTPPEVLESIKRLGERGVSDDHLGSMLVMSVWVAGLQSRIDDLEALLLEKEG